MIIIVHYEIVMKLNRTINNNNNNNNNNKIIKNNLWLTAPNGVTLVN